jgi:hypothetical protein
VIHSISNTARRLLGRFTEYSCGGMHTYACGMCKSGKVSTVLLSTLQNL